MNKRLLAVISTLVIASVLLVACGGGATPTAVPFACTDAIGCVDIAPTGTVHIAYALTVSGATATLGEDSKGAI